MRFLVLTGLAALVVVAISASTGGAASQSSWLYGADAVSTLFRIDPASGAATRIGETGISGMTDIAFTPDGKLYGVDFSRLYRIDARTGRATVIGAGIGLGSVNALASDGRGRLYVATTSGSFGVVATDTGRGTLIGSYGRFASSGDLAFAPNGTLYATGQQSGEVLLRVDPETGAATLQARLGLRDVYGLAFSPSGKLFAAASGNGAPLLVSIDPATGKSTEIGPIGGAQGMWGLATGTHVSTAPAPHPTQAVKTGYFKTPSGNIVCFHSPGPRDLPRPFLACGIKSGLKPAPPRRPCQEGGYAGDRVELLATGRVHVPSCAGDPGALVGEPTAPVLAYGKTWSGGGFRCTSAETGLTCRNKSRHGFFLSRERWRAF